MVFKCAKGMFWLKKNVKDAFNVETFVEKYLEEYFDKYLYIVGDISSEVLRLKGFDTDPKSENYFGFIEDYVEVSCAFGCPYYVLKRIRSQEEWQKLENKEVDTSDDRITITPMTKENFDKDSLVLKTSLKGKPNIVIDPRKINQIPQGSLPADLKDDAETSNQQKKKDNKPQENVVVQTFVSASADFDPSKKPDFRKQMNKNRKPMDNNKHKDKNNHNQGHKDKPNNKNFNKNKKDNNNNGKQ